MVTVAALYVASPWIYARMRFPAERLAAGTAMPYAPEESVAAVKRLVPAVVPPLIERAMVFPAVMGVTRETRRQHSTH